MSSFDPNNPDLQQLMADAVTQGLSPQDQATLDRMLRDSAEARDQMQQFELSAAAVDLALSAEHLRSPLPASLREQLIASATPYLSKPLDEAQAAEPQHHSLAEYRAAAAAHASTSPAARFSWVGPQALGWYAAIAALIALAFILLNPPTKQVEVERVVEVPAPTAPENIPATTNLDQRFAELLAKPDVVIAPWGYNADGGEDRFSNCSGQIVFDPETQTGYMKLTGLPVNDPNLEQYQLWIVDATRTDETTPRIDGGVFNVTDAGEVIVAVTPKIVANEPIVFALTMEKPGGVVVSKGPLQVVAVVQ